MSRPVTLFSAQWTDLPFEEFCSKAKSFGYDGVEIACWGDHMDVRKAATDPGYVEERHAILKKYGLKTYALGNHIAGQCVADIYDERLDTFAPADIAGDAEKIRQWGIEEMKYTARAAKAMGVNVVTGFMGSPIWRYIYSFPPVTEKMVEDGFALVRQLWDPIFDVFDEQGVKFGLEVHPGEIAYDYYTTKKLFEVFSGRKALGLNFDPSHLIWQGLKSEVFITDFPEKIYHVHMKDTAITADGRSGVLGSHLSFGNLNRGWNFRSLGRGDVDFEAIIRALNSIGYEGPLSVEWEDNNMDRELGAKEANEFTRKMNFSPSNVAFDASMEN